SGEPRLRLQILHRQERRRLVEPEAAPDQGRGQGTREAQGAQPALEPFIPRTPGSFQLRPRGTVSGGTVATMFCRWQMNMPAKTITAEPARSRRSGQSPKNS